MSKPKREIKPRYVSTNEVMTYLDISRNTLAEFSKNHNFEFRIGRRVLYDLKELDRIIEELRGVKHEATTREIINDSIDWLKANGHSDKEVVDYVKYVNG